MLAVAPGGHPPRAAAAARCPSAPYTPRPHDFVPAAGRAGHLPALRPGLPPHLSCALVYLQHELADHFPAGALSWLTWVTALDRLRPDLWVAPRAASLDALDVTRLAQCLAGSPALPALEPPLYGPRAGYLAQRLVNYTAGARDALAELEACPTAYGGRVWELVLGLAVGNGVAKEVFQAMCWDALPGAAPAGAPNAHERVYALRRARGEFDFPAGPPPAGMASRARLKK